MRILAADVGATKTLLQLAKYVQGRWQVCAQQRFENDGYIDFDEVMAAFLRSETAGAEGIDSACFAVAGPVRDGAVAMTNRPWSISAARLRERFQLPAVSVINDLEGAGYGLSDVEPERLLLLHPGDPTAGGVRALIGAGTGLGEAWMTGGGECCEVFAGEGGHVDFAPRDALERDLVSELARELGRVSYEHVLSGAGMQRIFNFLSARGGLAGSEPLLHDIQRGDPAAAISAHAQDDPLARQTVRRYLAIYGAQAANLALTVGARGGVYVVGGIAPKLAPMLRSGGFVRAFLDHPVMSAYLTRIPLTVVLDDNVALLGARVKAAGDARTATGSGVHA
jgi:glucokinase